MGAAAGAAIIVKEKHIVQAFRRAAATSAADAVPLESLGVHRRLAFRRLQRHAVLREAPPDRFYLDEPSWEALRRTRRRVALGLAVVAAAGLLLQFLQS